MESTIEVRPVNNQVDDLLEEIRVRVERGERVLCITLTKRLSEELSTYLKELGISAAYMHSELDALERIEVLYKYRRGDYNVLVGINLLREGIDIPELTLVAILDADKEGFLRSDTSLFQIVGRAARNVHGKAILYADTITDSMKKVIEETDRRRKVQQDYNKEHGITPATIQKELKPLVDPSLISTGTVNLDAQQAAMEDMVQESESEDVVSSSGSGEQIRTGEKGYHYTPGPAMKEVVFETKEALLEHLRQSMIHAAKNMEFEEAARIRDQIAKLEKEM
jgi:excinuclease ABC subunit B